MMRIPRFNSASRPGAVARLMLAALTLAASAVVPASTARAAFPERLIKIVVPFPPGGGTDLISRTLADVLSKELGQTVMVENKPGAGTVLGTAAAAGSAPDGYTLLMATFAHAVNPSLHAKLPFDTFRAFTPIALVGRSPNIVVVNPKEPYTSIGDLLAAARANPDKLNFGSYGLGTSAHLAGELFNTLAKVRITHVPYKGAAQAITDMLGGQIQVMFTTVASVSSYIPSGTLRALAVTSAERSPAYPNLPTVAEAGVPGYAAESWYGLYAPAGTPADVIARLNAAVRKAVQADAFAKFEQVEGLVRSAGTPEDLDRYVHGEEARWRAVVNAAGLKAE